MVARELSCPLSQSQLRFLPFLSAFQMLTYVSRILISSPVVPKNVGLEISRSSVKDVSSLRCVVDSSPLCCKFSISRQIMSVVMTFVKGAFANFRSSWRKRDSSEQLYRLQEPDAHRGDLKMDTAGEDAKLVSSRDIHTTYVITLTEFTMKMTLITSPQ